MKTKLICDTLHDLIPFVQFKKRDKHSWRTVTFSKVAGLKVTLLLWCFSRFLNCTNSSKSRKTSIYVIRRYYNVYTQEGNKNKNNELEDFQYFLII